MIARPQIAKGTTTRRRTIMSLSSIFQELKRQAHAKRGLCPFLGKRRKWARVLHRAERGAVIGGVPGAFLDPRRLDRSVSKDLDDDDGHLFRARHRRGSIPLRLDLLVHLTDVPREGEVPRIKTDRGR